MAQLIYHKVVGSEPSAIGQHTCIQASNLPTLGRLPLRMRSFNWRMFMVTSTMRQHKHVQKTQSWPSSLVIMTLSKWWSRWWLIKYLTWQIFVVFGSKWWICASNRFLEDVFFFAAKNMKMIFCYKWHVRLASFSGGVRRTVGASTPMFFLFGIYMSLISWNSQKMLLEAKKKWRRRISVTPYCFEGEGDRSWVSRAPLCF